MEPVQKLFQHIDGEPFHFIVHPKVNNAEQVERLIILHGGDLIDWNNITKADFMCHEPIR
ncbi:hypothetical protein M408DRAFT_330471 [Serendipita vermifera MAFF 305830]|uniref:Uncharacterized protein n=1 Tax=Serendipita vermifera MAFF 305830 TaxID=933852 RepID=A0A0C2XC48_SERVB|nr:hypothetical protein M408DRAFT_330471 [Serendipita vermifera MAFF 305830]